MLSTKTIEQTVTFDASPHDVYEALMDSEKHSQFTGAAASISREVGGSITAYDGYISGINIQLIPDTRIVQSWRGNDEGWPPGHHSTATFTFEKAESGTRLTFVQSGVPEGTFDDIDQGWKDHYWAKMKPFLES